MLLKMNIKNGIALIILRLYVALIYASIGIEFISRYITSNALGFYDVKKMSFFCLVISFFAIIPLFSFTSNKIKNIGTASGYFSIGAILLFHGYLIASFHTAFAVKYIFLSLVSNTLIQVPIVYLSKKVKNNGNI